MLIMRAINLNAKVSVVIASTLVVEQFHGGSRKQTCVASGTTEAEMHAIGEGIKEAVHLNGILHDMGISLPVVVKSDSQTALDVLTRGNGSKTKHYAESGIHHGHSCTREYQDGTRGISRQPR